MLLDSKTKQTWKKEQEIVTMSITRVNQCEK